MVLVWLLTIGLVLLVAAPFVIRAALISHIKNSMKTSSPKVPVSLCDKGHLVPDDMLLKLGDIPDVQDGVKICPICFNTNMENASKVPDETIHNK